ncbi:hypothetical protein TNCV_4065231 [Trichonephila clavipes]|uniref:Uncharacterized protein n=1 Tax=Trichonephila clavipes TaxID=2585209 RepID=A0A8X7BH85_TRICX|nr:hypothetical protein TNCV_4065231 [Trichonephila clavipes]
MEGSRSSDNVGRRSWDERRMSNDNSRRINWRDAEWYLDQTHDMPAMVGYLNHWATAARDNVGRRSWDERRMSNDNSRRINWRDADLIHRPSDRRSNYRGNYEKGPQWS